MRKTHILFKILPLTALQRSASLLLFEAVYLGGLTASKRRHSFIFKPAEQHHWFLTAFLSLPINSKKQLDLFQLVDGGKLPCVPTCPLRSKPP